MANLGWNWALVFTWSVLTYASTYFSICIGYLLFKVNGSTSLIRFGIYYLLVCHHLVEWTPANSLLFLLRDVSLLCFMGFSPFFWMLHAEAEHVSSSVFSHQRVSLNGFGGIALVIFEFIQPLVCNLAHFLFLNYSLLRYWVEWLRPKERCQLYSEWGNVTSMSVIVSFFGAILTAIDLQVRRRK